MFFIGRILIVNILGVSCLWYVVKVIFLFCWVYDSFKLIIWFFIWRGKMENVSCDCCCVFLLFGGFNVVNFKVKCVSLCFFVFFSLRDDFGIFKWYYLV